MRLQLLHRSPDILSVHHSHSILPALHRLPGSRNSCYPAMCRQELSLLASYQQKFTLLIRLYHAPIPTRQRYGPASLLRTVSATKTCLLNQRNEGKKVEWLSCSSLCSFCLSYSVARWWLCCGKMACWATAARQHRLLLLLLNKHGRLSSSIMTTSTNGTITLPITCGGETRRIHLQPMTSSPAVTRIRSTMISPSAQ